MKKIRNIETLLFIIGATTIMLLGADFPPPPGFAIILIVIILVAVIQWCYLKWLLLHINTKGSLLITGGVFAGLGVVATMFIIVSNCKSVGDYTILIAIVTVIAFIYGLALWLVNFILSSRL
jgi:hypothetical protein